MNLSESFGSIGSADRTQQQADISPVDARRHDRYAFSTMTRKGALRIGWLRVDPETVCYRDCDSDKGLLRRVRDSGLLG